VAIDEAAIHERVATMRAHGLTTKDSIRAVSDETGLPRNTVYGIVHGPRGQSS